MGIVCCECNKDSISKGVDLNLENKIKQTGYLSTREDRISQRITGEKQKVKRGSSLSGTNIQSSLIETIKPAKDLDQQIPSLLPYVPNDKIPEHIINNSKKLCLTIIQSKYLTEGKKLIINAGGLVGSPRNALDGYTIFGDISNGFQNDFEFPEEESNTGQSHAEIKFIKNLNEYQVKSLRGSGCFIKIEQKIMLENGSLFSFSNFMIHVKIEIKSSNDDIYNNLNNKTSCKSKNADLCSEITLEVIYGEEERRQITFDSNNKRFIKIGRLKNKDTDFYFEDYDVSRKQCVIFYEDSNWFIKDGDGDKLSSNGTWFYPEKYFTIFDNMIIRMGTTSFKCQYTK